MRRHWASAAIALSLAAFGTSAPAYAFDPDIGAPDSTRELAEPTAPGRAVLIHAADLALQGNRLVEARALLEQLKAIPGGSDQDQTNLLWGELMIASGRPADALQWLSLLDQGERQGCRATSAEGMALIQTSAFKAADDLLLSRETQCAGDPVYWRTAGRAHLALAQYAAAIEALRKALALQPGDDAARNELAVALIEAGNPGEAAEFLSDLARKAPEQAEVLMNLDYANGMLGRMPVRRPSDSDSLWSDRLQYAGSGAQRSGRLALAEALLGQALIERPRHDGELWRQYSELAAKR